MPSSAIIIGTTVGVAVVVASIICRKSYSTKKVIYTLLRRRTVRVMVCILVGGRTAVVTSTIMIALVSEHIRGDSGNTVGLTYLGVCSRALVGEVRHFDCLLLGIFHHQ